MPRGIDAWLPCFGRRRSSSPLAAGRGLPLQGEGQPSPAAVGPADGGPEVPEVAAGRTGFEAFPPSLRVRRLPVIVFTTGVEEQRVWYDGQVTGGKVSRPDEEPDVVAVDPVVMSPAYLGFSVEPYEQRYLHYRGVGVVFARPMSGKFMQPSIDTILVCAALHSLFSQGAAAAWVPAPAAQRRPGSSRSRSSASSSSASRSSSPPSARGRQMSPRSPRAAAPVVSFVPLEPPAGAGSGGGGALGGRRFSRAIDIGSGSGFLGKFVAAYAPGDGDLDVTLVDIDRSALDYCRTPGFNAPPRGLNGRQVRWRYEARDAVELLREDADYDLLVSNPPYIPTERETRGDTISEGVAGFWEGIGLVVHLIDLVAEKKCRDGAHLVLMISSLTLKSVGVRRTLEAAPGRGLQVRILAEREIAWKAWYAGPRRGTDHLLATDQEAGSRQHIGGNDYFVGATPPGRSRTGQNGRDQLYDYHWHMGYVLCVHRADTPDG